MTLVPCIVLDKNNEVGSAVLDPRVSGIILHFNAVNYFAPFVTDNFINAKFSMKLLVVQS